LIQWLGSTGIFVLICIIIIALIIDISIVRIATSIGGLGQSYIVPFIWTVLVFGVGQYAILAYVKSEHKLNHNQYKISSHLTGRNLIDNSVTVSQYVLLAVLVSVIFQMMLRSSTMFLA
jgi:hypothetical protein